DAHAGPGRAVERAGHIDVLEGVHLELNVARTLAAVRGDLPLDAGEERLLQVRWRRQELLVGALGAVAGRQGVEELGHVLAHGFVAGEEPEVAVDAGGARVVVAGTDVDVTSE